MTDAEIIQQCLAEIPVGNINVHTKENLPLMVREYVKRCIQMNDAVERISDIVEETYNEEDT